MAILGTTNANGSVHLVPITFALQGDVLYSAVDHKPKSTRSLKRLDNIRRDARATVLVEHYEEDWSALWWCRLGGSAVVAEGDANLESARELLAAKYPHYASNPPAGPWIIMSIETLTGWAASA